MSLRAICPECGTTATVDQYSHKKSVICKQCGSTFPIPGAKTAGPPPLPKKSEPANAGFEVLDDEEERPEKPARKSAEDEVDDLGSPAVGRSKRRERDQQSAEDDDKVTEIEEVSDIEEVEPDERPRRSAATRGREDEEEEDDDDEPSPKLRLNRDDDEDDEPAPRFRRDRDDEDDEEHSIPRRRPGDRERKGGRKSSLVVGLLLFLLLGAGGAFAVYKFVLDDEEPKVVADNDDEKPEPGPEKPDPKLPDPKVPDPKIPQPKNLVPTGLSIQPAKFDGDKKSIKLPGKVASIRAGGDGRYLFLNCPEEKKLLVYDASEASIIKEIETTGKDVRIAAGIDKLIVADNSTRTIQRYDLLSLKKDKESPYPFPGIFEEISIGSGSNGLALVVSSLPTNAWPIHFLDLGTLAKADVGWNALPAGDLPKNVNFFAAANGSRWAGVADGVNGAIVVSREGKRLTVAHQEREKPLGFATLSPDGKHLISRYGAAPIGAPVAQASGQDSPGFVAPAVSGMLFIHVIPSKNAAGDFGVRVAVTNTPSQPPVSFPKVSIPQPYIVGDPTPPDGHIFFIPEAQTFVICPSFAEDTLEIIKYDVVAAQRRAAHFLVGTIPDSFQSGTTFSYQIRSINPVPQRKFEVTGPEGITVNLNGLVTWKVPEAEKRDRVTISVSATANGIRSTQSVEVFNVAASSPKPIEPKVVEPKPKDPKEPMPKDPKSPDPKIPTTNIAPGVKLVQEAGGKLPITPPMMTEPRIEVALPAAISDACVAGGGRYLIFHCPKARKLVVFDVNTLKVEKTITVNSDDVLFAAGMNKLMLIYPDSKDVIRYDLTSFKLEANEVLEVRQRPTVAGMGSGVAGPLILGGIPSQNNASKMALTFIDPDTLKEILIEKAEGDFKVTFAAAAKMRVSANGATIGAWFEQLQPTGLQIARLSGNTISGSYLGESVGHVAPGSDGKNIFTEKGLFDNKAKPEGPRFSVVPASQGAGYILLTGNPGEKQQAAVWGSDKEKPINTFDDLPGFDGKRDPFERDNPNLALDRRLFFVPDAKILVVVPPAANKLFVYRLEPMKK